jgi:hypothetical protein
MNVFAYCTLVAADTVARATGVTPFTSPPWDAETFRPAWLAGRDLIYFRLHGLPGAYPVWFGEGADGNLTPAFCRPNLGVADLGGATVVIANCYSTHGPLLQAFYDAGAGAVIAAPGENYAAGNVVLGADLLAKWVILGLRLGLSVERALQLAKTRLILTAWRISDRDALGFRIISREYTT